MKRRTARLITLVLALALACASALLPARAEGSLTLLGKDAATNRSELYDTAIASLCRTDDTLCILTRDGKVYTYKAGDGDAALFIDDARIGEYSTRFADETAGIVTRLFADGGTLYGFNEREGVLFPLSADADKKAVYGPAVLLDFTGLCSYYGDNDQHRRVTMQFCDMDMAGGTLYISGYNYDSAQEDPVLYAFDIATGARRDYASKVIYSFCPYKDGQLLCMVTEPSRDMYDREKGVYKPWTVCALDLAGDALTPLASVSGEKFFPNNVAGIQYDAAADTLYFATDNKIFRMVSFGEPELCAYTPVSNVYAGSGDFNSAYFAGRYALNDSYGLYLRAVDPALLPAQTLSIYGAYANDAHRMAASHMDDIPIFFYDEGHYASAQELGQALAAGDSQIDLLRVSLSRFDLDRLMSKGYCYDLSGQQALAAFADELYPFIREAVSHGGKLYAIPVSTSAEGFGYNKEAFDALGMTPPDNWLDLIDMTHQWAQDEDEEKLAQYALQQQVDTYRFLFFERIIWNYEQSMLAQGQQLSLDTPVFRRLMQALDAMNTERIEITESWTDTGDPTEELEELWNKTHLYQLYKSYRVTADRYELSAMTPRPLSLTGEEAPVTPVSMQVFFINPRSKNIDAALRYLTAYAQSMDAITLANMCPGDNEPIENQHFAASYKEMEKSLQAIQDTLDKASEADKPMYQEELDYYASYMAEYAANERYDATPASIAQYRDVMQYAVVAKPSVLWNTSDASFQMLLQRFLEGQLPLEQFIQEANGKLRLMQLESQ